MPGVRCLPRDSRPRMAGAVKRLLEFGYAGADGGFDGSGSAAMRSAAHTRGAGQRAVAEAEGWHDAGRHWSASPNYQRARGHAAPSYLSGCSRRLRSAEPAAVRVCCGFVLRSRAEKPLSKPNLRHGRADGHPGNGSQMKCRYPRKTCGNDAWNGKNAGAL